VRSLLRDLRVVVNITVCRALTHGISHSVGHVAIDTLADLVLWKPENFGSKPEMVLKSGVIVWSQACFSNTYTSTISLTRL
jgi:urease